MSGPRFDPLRERCVEETGLMMETLGDLDRLDKQVSQAERIRVVGKCCNIIRELNRAELRS